MSSRFFNMLSLFLMSSSVLANSAQPIIKDNSQFSWNKMPNSLGSYAILAGDPKKNAWFILRVKFPANYNVRVHHHLNYEYDTVISGTAYIAMGKSANKSKGIATHRGQFVVIPPNIPHYGWTGNKETIIQISGLGPWNPLYN